MKEFFEQFLESIGLKMMGLVQYATSVFETMDGISSKGTLKWIAKSNNGLLLGCIYNRMPSSANTYTVTGRKLFAKIITDYVQVMAMQLPMPN